MEACGINSPHYAKCNAETEKCIEMCNLWSFHSYYHHTVTQPVAGTFGKLWNFEGHVDIPGFRINLSVAESKQQANVDATKK